MLDREPEELQFLGVGGILLEATKILKACGRLLALLTLTFIVPLSLAILGHALMTGPLLDKIHHNEDILEKEVGSPAEDHTLDILTGEWTTFLGYEAGYLVFLLIFSLLSTAAIVYTVACVYTAKHMGYSKILSVIPRVWKRLMSTFLWYFLILVVYNFVALIVLVLVITLFGIDTIGFAIFGTLFLAGFVIFHVYISAIWHVASVVSVLEDKKGVEAMKKGNELIQGKRWVVFVLIFIYFVVNAFVQGGFSQLVVHGSGAGRVLWGIVFLGLMVCVNLVGLLGQSVVYYVCKSFHHQSIDKSALSEHLEEYLGDYVPLKSSIQMENMDV